MLLRQVIGYAPSLLIPALTAFGTVFFYTRMLSPAEYGHYTLAVNMMVLLSMIFFCWLQVSLPRLMPQAAKQGRQLQMKATTYIIFALASIALVVCSGIFIETVPLGDLYTIAWIAVPLTLFRSLLNLNEAVHRSAMDHRRYNLVECGQAVLGLGMGLALIYFLNMGSMGAILGLLFGLVFMALVDIGIFKGVSRKNFSREALKDIVHFGLPLVAIYAFTFTISTSDRFLVEYFQGPAQVGLYASGYIPMDRIMMILFLLVSTPSYPLTMHKYEHEGVEAAREQTYKNGIAVLMLVMPACAGLILVNREMANILIGDEFREGALKVMPWIAVSSFFAGLSIHYFDHAFYIAKKSARLLYTQGPAAASNIILNLILIPKIGYMGAVYSTVFSYALMLVLSIWVGRSAFRVHFPVRPALRIALATAIMALAVSLLPVPENLYGFIGKILIGVVVYALGIHILKVPYKILMDIKSASPQEEQEPLVP